MSSLTWVEILEEQQIRARVLSPERMRAEMLWAQITGKAPDIFGPFVGVPEPLQRKAPQGPRARGKNPCKRKGNARHAVLVERKGARRMLQMPDGKMLAGPRRVTRTTITIAS
jgi:hypothetical protein